MEKAQKAKSPSEEMDDLFHLAVQEIRDIFKDNKEFSKKAQLASSTLGIYTRLKSQENTAKSFQYRIIKDFAADKSELREYIEKTQPDFKGLKKIGM